MLPSEKKLLQIKEYLKNHETVFEEYLKNNTEYIINNYHNHYYEYIILEDPEIRYEISTNSVNAVIELKLLTANQIKLIRHVFFSISKSAWYSKIRVANCTRLCIGNDLLNICKDYFRFSQRLACRNQ